MTSPIISTVNASKLEFVFPDATEMQTAAKKNYDARVAAEAAEEKIRKDAFDQKVQAIWDDIIPRVACRIRDAVDAGMKEAIVFQSRRLRASVLYENEACKIDIAIGLKVYRFLDGLGYPVRSNTDNDGHSLVVILIP